MTNVSSLHIRVATALFVASLVLITSGLFASLCGSQVGTTTGYTTYGPVIACGGQVCVPGLGCVGITWECEGGHTTVPTTQFLNGVPGTMVSDGNDELKGEVCEAEHCTLTGCGGGDCRETTHNSVKTKGC